MRVGITCRMEYSVFSTGSTNTSIALAELMKGLGYTPTLINLNSSSTWWEDCLPAKKIFASVNLSDLSLNLDSPSFDLILEVSAFTLSAAERKALTRASVWVLRKPFVLSEIESSIYPMNASTRELDGIQETWLMNDMCSSDDISAIEVITRRPVIKLSFVWTPLIAEIHHRSIGSPVWKGTPNQKVIVHMVDTNSTSSSSSTIPLVILRECNRQKLPIETWRLHNGELIAKSRFFRENVLKHCSDLDLSGECVGRQRCVEWTSYINNISLAHIRFRSIRPVLLDLTWVGIPVVHNSTILKDKVGGGLDQFYYSNNSVGEGARAMNRVINMIQTDLSGWSNELKNRRERMLMNWSPVSPTIRAEWNIHLSKFVPSSQSLSKEPSMLLKNHNNINEYNILFCDMWEDFQADYNFFTLLLKNALPEKSIKGYNISNIKDVKPHLVIFGPFGKTWLNYPGVPKVYFTGENTLPINNEDVRLNLCFNHIDMASKKYLRFPLWFTEINWFAADVERLVNPKPIPLELCTRTNKHTFSARSKFCSFIVSNPKNNVRNQAFHWLNSYKPVDSAGALYNNTGSALFAGAGGGGGEIRKTQFMMDYKFAFAYENESSNGYTTEKYLHAKAAGAVPIYWGDPNFERDFDLSGCLDARRVKTPDDLIALVKSCESETEWSKKAAVPALSSYKVEIVRRTLAECAKRIYEILGANTDSIPLSIGASPGSVEANYGMENFVERQTKLENVPSVSTAIVTPSTPSTLKVPLLVTYATYNFLGSLQHWLTSAKSQLRVFPHMKALVFLGPDIKDETLVVLKEKYTFVEFEYVPHTWTPSDFSDFWEPTHYAWKIWILHNLVRREKLKNNLILYMDAGAVLVRYPKTWMASTLTHGIVCLEDFDQENENWCSDQFCKLLNVTDSERSAKQIWAGSMCFVAGHELSIEFFTKAFEYAQQRNIIVGPRLAGVSEEGKSYGHRQDQSILSILVRRYPIQLLPLDSVYCDHSMRKTFQSGKSIYAHRGNFQKAVPFLPGIDDAFIINLDRRADRMTKFWDAHPTLKDRVNRVSATDGTSMTLTPELSVLLKPNDFFWKKAVAGCAMSHLTLWWKLVNEHPDIQNYLIFEDDAKMRPGWEEMLADSVEHIPKDYDVLYLGGILPPNRAGFESLLEPVTKYYSRIKPHQSFGQREPNRYFHSCAYAYIISRGAAVKIMEGLQAKKGIWTSADHIMCNPCDIMNNYFFTPIIGGCIQDSDPVYVNSEFNNFSRVDKFDSDLWNNDERFSIPSVVTPEPFELRPLLESIFSPKAPPSTLQHSKVENLLNPYTGPTMTDKNGKGLPIRFLRYNNQALDFSKHYETDWLLALFGPVQSLSVENMVDIDTPMDYCPIVFLERPFVDEISKILTEWSQKGATFKIIHFSDEGEGNIGDFLESYTLRGCKSVLRFYSRDNYIPKGTESKINIIPLGFHWSRLKLEYSPLLKTPQLPFREIHWCFYGTKWANREEEMAPLINSKMISSYKFYNDWKDPENMSGEDYMSNLLNTIFVPCPGGINAETFRIYEALEAGCIPLILHTEKNDAWFRWISNHLPLLDISSWKDAERNMLQLLSKPETLEIYRTQLLEKWVAWYTILKKQTRQWLLN